MRKNFAVLGLTIALSAGIIAGCGQTAENTTAAAAGAETTAAADVKTTAAGTEAAAAGAETTTAAGTETTAAAKEGDYQYVSPEDAVAAAKDKSAHVLDVREWGNYVEGRVADTLWCPIFPLEDESLVEGMAAFAKNNLNDGNKIYIICNSGKRGAEKTTGVLLDNGIDASLIYTVEGGAKALGDVKGALTTNRAEEQIDWNYISAEEALKAVGTEDAQIVDVRDDKTYAEGHLQGSAQVALKEFESAKAQTAMYEFAQNLDKEKPVYFLCYSGNNCAKTAISVLKDAGFDNEKLFIIENGAKDESIQAAFVTE